MPAECRTAVKKYVGNEKQVDQIDDLQPGQSIALIEGKLVRHQHATDNDQRQNQPIPQQPCIREFPDYRIRQTKVLRMPRGLLPLLQKRLRLLRSQKYRIPPAPFR